MRRIAFSIIMICLVSGGVLGQVSNKYPPPPDPAQWAKDSIKPYQKNPELPAFNLLMPDTTTIFNTFNIAGGKVTAIILFDPHCKHCKHSIGGLMKAMDSVKDVQFYFVTLIHDMEEVKKFYKDYHMADHPNIKAIGRDYEFFFVDHYRVLNIPDVALYDENKKFIKLIERDFSATSIREAIDEHRKH